MKIDTWYTAEGEMKVDLVLQTRKECALTDDLLFRLALNQHRLKWTGNPGHAEIAADPATFRMPATHKGRVASRRRTKLGHAVILIFSIIDA